MPTKETVEDVTELIRARIESVFESPWDDDVYKAPDIPPKKLRNAIGAYAEGVDPERVVALHDWTLLGGAKDGSIFTDATLYLKPSFAEPEVYPYRGINKVTLVEGDGEDDDSGSLALEYEDGTIRSITHGDYFNLPRLKEFFLAIVEANKRGLTREVDGFVIVQDMGPETKLSFIGALAWLTWQDDRQIDSREMTELQVLLTQLDFDAPLRARARSLIGNSDELDATSLVDNMKSTAPSGSEVALGVALIRDAIRVHRATSQGPALKNGGVVKLAKLLAINEEQIELIEAACQHDEKILSGELSDSELKEQAKELAAKASAVGIPIAAVYLSGSVVGLSAAGITSGLAGLGLGGVLGLSSMVTGVGVVVLLGVGAYKGVRWLSGGSQRSKASRREFMLKEVLLVHQKAISNLGEDIAYFAQELVELTRDSNIRRAQVEALGRKVQLLASTIHTLRAKEDVFELALQEEVQATVDA